jgi:4,5-DOPA dioxygenase extradiol
MNEPTDTPERMPALYIGHGAPPLLDDPVWSGELASWAAALPRPQAILIVSAHWESAPVTLSASGPGTRLVYDFGGFAQRYYQMTYDTPDARWRPGSRRWCPPRAAGGPSTSTRPAGSTTAPGCR